MQNPYSTMFGKVPAHIIPREQQTSRVIESFSAAEPDRQAFVITGVNGSGKTVFMTDVARRLAEDGRWVRVELRGMRDMDEELVAKLVAKLIAKLGGDRSLSECVCDAGIDGAALNLRCHAEVRSPSRNVCEALSQLLKTLENSGRRLLITVDEVVDNARMRGFASLYHMLASEGLPVFLLMAGLHENVESLWYEKDTASLCRVLKIVIEPLELRPIALDYEHTFGIGRATAFAMARLTGGYAFAFQLLGYLAWEHRGLTGEVLDAYRLQLFDLSLDKTWRGLSSEDWRIASGAGFVSISGWL